MAGPVICAIDLEHDARGPLAMARRLAEALGRGLVVVHVTTPGALTSALPATGAGAPVPGPGVPHVEPHAADPGELERLREDARERVARIVSEAGTGDAEVVVELGARAEDRLREVASERQAELLVVGSRGHGAVRAALLGSTSHALAGDAPCPVVVVGPQ
jgi:nucleotide-binding universal stress UspA family protein